MKISKPSQIMKFGCAHTKVHWTAAYVAKTQEPHMANDENERLGEEEKSKKEATLKMVTPTRCADNTSATCGSFEAFFSLSQNFTEKRKKIHSDDKH